MEEMIKRIVDEFLFLNEETITISFQTTNNSSIKHLSIVSIDATNPAIGQCRWTVKLYDADRSELQWFFDAFRGTNLRFQVEDAADRDWILNYGVNVIS